MTDRPYGHQRKRLTDGEQAALVAHVSRRPAPEAMMPNAEIGSAIVASKELRSRGAEDVLATVRECGVAVGDGSPDQGCPQ